MFLHISRDNKLTNRYIESVAYVVGKPFETDPPEFKATNAPFTFSRICADTIFIQVDVKVTI
jgi:hypothetical protein